MFSSVVIGSPETKKSLNRAIIVQKIAPFPSKALANPDFLSLSVICCSHFRILFFLFSTTFSGHKSVSSLPFPRMRKDVFEKMWLSVEREISCKVSFHFASNLQSNPLKAEQNA